MFRQKPSPGPSLHHRQFHCWDILYSMIRPLCRHPQNQPSACSLFDIAIVPGKKEKSHYLGMFPGEDGLPNSPFGLRSLCRYLPFSLEGTTPVPSFDAIPLPDASGSIPIGSVPKLIPIGFGTKTFRFGLRFGPCRICKGRKFSHDVKPRSMHCWHRFSPPLAATRHLNPIFWQFEHGFRGSWGGGTT